jgi:hypothetical protein
MLLLSLLQKSKRPWEPTPMAFSIRRQKSHGDEPAHPWLPFTIWIDLGAWISPAKKERKIEKQIR